MKKRIHFIAVSLLLVFCILAGISLSIYLVETRDIEENGTYTEAYWNKYVNRRYYMIENMEEAVQIRSLNVDEVIQILGTTSAKLREVTENGGLYIASIGYHDIDREIGVTFSYYVYFDSQGSVIDTFLWEGS